MSPLFGTVSEDDLENINMNIKNLAEKSRTNYTCLRYELIHIKSDYNTSNRKQKIYYGFDCSCSKT